MAKKIKFKSSKRSIRTGRSYKRYFDLFILVILTSLIIASIIISLPQTERLLPNTDFDLNLKENDYIGQSYTLQFQTSGEESNNIDKKIEDSKDIIHKRLNKYGVEVVKMENIESKDEKKDEDSDTPVLDELENTDQTEEVNIIVETTKDIDRVSTLIGNRNYLRIVTPKEGAVLDDPEDQIAPYLVENYDYTKFTLHRFRSIVIKELPTTTGDTAFFGIYKPTLLNSNDFYDLLDQYAGKQIGIMVDGFVQPYNVPFEFNTEAQQNTAKPDFAPAVASTPEDAEVVGIIDNSGVIPLPYNIIDQIEVPVTQDRPSYYTSIAVVFATLLAIVVYIGWRNIRDKEENITFVLSVIVTYSAWLSILKLSSTPVDLDIMYFTGFLLIFLVKLFNYRKTSMYAIELTVGGILLLLYFSSEGYTNIFAQQMLISSLIAVIVVTLMNYYIVNMNKYLIK